MKMAALADGIPDAGGVFGRLWWFRFDGVCRTIEELIDLTFDWFGYKKHFEIETSIYPQALAA